MEFLEYARRVYEITIFASVDEDTLLLECADMAQDGGLLFVLRRALDGEILLRAQGREIPMGLIQLAEAIASRELPEGSTQSQ